jgi:CBS domain-containing protein
MMDINDYIILSQSTIYEALVKIEKNKQRSLIVIDDDNKVVGSLSDGDIRKGLLNHILLDAPVFKVMNLNFKMLYETPKAEELNEIFNFYNIFVIPIIDQNFKLLDIKVR